MKNQLPELTPKPESWDKILGRISFENQLQDHLQNLPEFHPDEETWSKIEIHLEEKKAVSFWPTLRIAAGFFGILLISGWVVFNWKSEKLSKPQVHPLTTAMKKEIPITIENSELEKPEIAEKTQLNPVISQREKEFQLATLEVPEIEFIALEPEILLPEPVINQEEIIEMIPKKTLHEVTISWGIESSKPKIGTSFGRQDPYLNQTFQTDKKSIRIRFGQDN